MSDDERFSGDSDRFSDAHTSHSAHHQKMLRTKVSQISYEEDDHVSDLLARSGSMMSSNSAAEREKRRIQQVALQANASVGSNSRPGHQHNNSIPTLSFPPMPRVGGGTVTSGSGLQHSSSFSMMESPSALGASSSLNPAASLQPPPDKSGWLYKRGNLNSSWKKRWFVLRYQTLKYYKKSGDIKSKGFIPLSGALLNIGTSEKMKRLFGFEIASSKYSRVYVIHAESEREMQEWVDALEKNVEYVEKVIEKERMLSGGGSNSQLMRGGGLQASASFSMDPNSGLLSAKNDPLNTSGGKSRNPANTVTTPMNNTAASTSALTPSPFSPLLNLELSEDYLKSLGIPPRLSTWRRDTYRIGYDEPTKKLVHISTIKSSWRMSNVGVMTTHNMMNCVAVGTGVSWRKGGETKTGGALVQLINVDTRDSVSSLSVYGRTGNSEAFIQSARQSASKTFAGVRSTAVSSSDDSNSTSSSNISGGIPFSTSSSYFLQPCQGEVSSLDWRDDRLFIGSSGGVVGIYNTPDTINNSANQQVNIQPLNFLHHAKLQSDALSLPAPGKYHPTSRISYIELNPDKRSLLTLSNQFFFLWDLERSTLVASEVGSNYSTPILAGAWNRHGTFAVSGSSSSTSTATGNEFMYGGEEGVLRLLDVRMIGNMDSAGGGGSGISSSSGAPRSSSVPWLVSRAHTSSIRSIAWSPLVPYWIASGGDDGLVKVWDTRFGAEPVRVLSEHQNTVTKIRWSRSHAEMLCSSSSDRTVRVWNLRTGPHYTVYTHGLRGSEDTASDTDDLTSSVIHADFSPKHPFQLHVGSTSGEVVVMHLDKELIANFAVHRSFTTNTNAAATSKKPDTSPTSEEKESGSPTLTPALPPTAASSSPNDSSTSVVSPTTRTFIDDTAEREISTLLYLRDYSAGFRCVANLAQKYCMLGYYQQANQLLKLTSRNLFEPAMNEPGKILAAAGAGATSASTKPSASSKESKLDLMRLFNTLLQDLCRFLPSRSLELTAQDDITRSRIEFLGLRLMISDRIQSGQYLGLLAMADKICKHLAGVSGSAATAGAAASPTSTSSQSVTSAASSPAASSNSASATLDARDANNSMMDQFDSAILEKMASTILLADHIRGLDFCLRIGKTLQASGNFQLFLGIARVVFHPTIYERMDEASTSATTCSIVKMLSQLAMTPLAQAQQAGGVHDSESESDEYSRNSISSSTMSRKQSDLDVRKQLRPSISMLAQQAAQAREQRANENPRSGIERGNEMQHAQITLDRDLRNPKIVIVQLTLLKEMLGVLATVDDPAAETAIPPTGSPASSSTSESAAKSSSSQPIIRFNPYLASQPTSIASRISLDTLGLPALNTTAAKELARLYEEMKEPHKILGALPHLLYFLSLITQKKLDLVFVSGTKFVSNNILKNYHLANVIEGVMNELVTPKFQVFLERLLVVGAGGKEAATASGKSSSSSAAATAAASTVGAHFPKLQAGSLTILNMLYNCEYLPSALHHLLPRYFTQFHDALQKTLLEIRRNPNYVPSTSYSTAKSDCKAKAESLLTQIARIKSHSKLVGSEPHLSELVNEFVTMLKKFQE